MKTEIQVQMNGYVASLLASRSNQSESSCGWLFGSIHRQDKVLVSDGNDTIIQQVFLIISEYQFGQDIIDPQGGMIKKPNMIPSGSEWLGIVQCRSGIPLGLSLKDRVVLKSLSNTFKGKSPGILMNFHSTQEDDSLLIQDFGCWSFDNSISSVKIKITNLSPLIPRREDCLVPEPDHTCLAEKQVWTDTLKRLQQAIQDTQKMQIY
jgi:hypothetical protein